MNRRLWVVVAWPARFWKRFISPFMPPACRFEPTCSVYAAEAKLNIECGPGIMTKLAVYYNRLTSIIYSSGDTISD